MTSATDQCESPDQPPRGLPYGWIAQWDPNYRRFFFVDTTTNFSTWLDPRPQPAEQSQSLQLQGSGNAHDTKGNPGSSGKLELEQETDKDKDKGKDKDKDKDKLGQDAKSDVDALPELPPSPLQIALLRLLAGTLEPEDSASQQQHQHHERHGHSQSYSAATPAPDFEIPFDEVDDRITEFQEDMLVKEALSKVQITISKRIRSVQANACLVEIWLMSVFLNLLICIKGVNLREYASRIETDLSLIEDGHVIECEALRICIYCLPSIFDHLHFDFECVLVLTCVQYLQDIRQTHELIKLNGQIQECDTLLENMETLLRGHQEHLGTINAEISILQEQSRTMTIKLKNRNATQAALNELLEGTVVSPDLIKKICEGEINEFFLQHLSDLNKKMSFVKSRQEKKIRSFKDVGPELDRLRFKSSEKIREFLLKKIEALKAPNTNIAVIQQTVFLKYKELFWFLMERYSDVALEIHGNYVITVSNYYFASFEKYIKAISKFQMDKTNVFTLGDRVNLLTNSDPDIILPHIAEEKNLKVTHESIFKSISRLLLDNACAEYIFTTDFFAGTKTNHPIEVPGVVFTEIFDQTLKYIQAAFKTQIDASFDAVGILICIRINSQNIRIMQKRRIPCLESFLNVINILLWPRFQAIIDMHIDSLKKAVVGRLLPTKDVHPHYVRIALSRYMRCRSCFGYCSAALLLTSSLILWRLVAKLVKMQLRITLCRLCGDMPSSVRRY
eukprot:jgi/Hompol1/980/HPOL_001180-RA